MFCRECGTQLKETQKFCTNCGLRTDAMTGAATVESSLPPQVPKPLEGRPSPGQPSKVSSLTPEGTPAMPVSRGLASTASPRQSIGAAQQRGQPRETSISPVLLWGSVFLAVAGAIGVSLWYLSSRPASPVPDAEIIRSIQTRFATDPNLSKYTIEVRCQDGVVTLAGFVNSNSDKDSAVRTATAQAGVKQVDVYGLVVAGSSSSVSSSSNLPAPGLSPLPSGTRATPPPQAAEVSPNPSGSQSVSGGAWLGFANETTPKGREAELHRNCRADFTRVIVPLESGNTFTDLCRSVGKTCERVCDWEGTIFPCTAVSQGGRRDGTRIAVCR